MTLDDQQLMNGILKEWPDALDRLYKRYRIVLKSIIMQVLHDETEADDVLQDVFLQVWNRARSYSAGKGKLLSWLCTLARRRAIDRLSVEFGLRILQIVAGRVSTEVDARLSYDTAATIDDTCSVVVILGA